MRVSRALGCRFSALGPRLSALGYQLSALGCQLSALASRLSAFRRLKALARWPGAQPRCQLDDIRAGRRLEFALQELGVRIRGAYGAGPISSGIECAHESQHGTGAIAGHVHQSPPAIHRLAPVAGSLCAFSMRVQDIVEFRCQPNALRRLPLLELRGAIQEKSIQKGAAICVDRLPQVAAAPRLPKRGNVAREQGSVESHVAAFCLQHGVAKRLAQHVDRNIQQMPRLAIAVLWPQESHDLLARRHIAAGE